MTNMVQCVMVSEQSLSEVYKDYELPATGLASWEIIKTESGKSKSMNAITKVTYEVLDSKNKAGYMVISVPMNVEWRVAQMGSITNTSDMVKEGRVDIDLWVGKKGIGFIEHKPYKDEMRANWKYFKRPKKVDEFPTQETNYSQESPPISQPQEFDDDINF